MTQVYQLSGKTDDGRIFVVGGETFEEFRTNVLAATGDATVTDALIADAVAVLSGPSTPAPFAQATQTVTAAFPQAQPATPPSPPQQAQGQAPIGKNGKPMRWVPAGVSKKTGRAYEAFWAEDRDR